MFVYKQQLPIDRDVWISFGVLAASSLLVVMFPWTVVFALPYTWHRLFKHGWIGRRFYEMEMPLYDGKRYPSELWTFNVYGLDNGCGYPKPYRESVPSEYHYVASWRQEVFNMPKELQTLFPDLYMSETSVAGFVGGVPLYGVVDQVFRDKDGNYVIVDTKTRPGTRGPSSSDILQLSFYRAILVQKLGEENVSKKAYVRLVDSMESVGVLGHSWWREVTLLPTLMVAECVQKLTKIRHTRPAEKVRERTEE